MKTLTPKEKIEKMILQFWDTGKIITEEINVTPEMAEYFLSINKDNRPVSHLTVDRYAKDMAAGRWSLNGEAIVVSDEGILNTGQHRALACIKANCAFPSLVVVGVKHDARHTDGQGLAKQAAHRLYMLGHSEHDLLSKSASLLMALNSGKVNFNPRSNTIWMQSEVPSQLEVVEYAEKRKDDILLMHSFYTRTRYLDKRRMAAFGVYLKDKGASVNDIKSFMESLFLGANLDVDSPIFNARRRLLNDTEKLTPAQFFEILFRTWNHWKLGLKVVKSLPIMGKMPSIET